MQSNQAQQAQADHPEYFSERLKKMCVAIQRFRPQKQLEVADHVPAGKQE